MEKTEIINLFPNKPVARYNVTAWQKSENDNVVLVGREVEKAADIGEPDIGKLVLVELDPDNTIVHERVIWEPQHSGFYLEDPRALILNNKNIIIGLTAVVRSRNGDPVPFPAIVKIPSQSTWNDVLPPTTFIQTFGPGKNLTPITKNIFFFRPDAHEYHHKLLIFEIKNSLPNKLQDLEFPKNLSWAKWRLGTTMSPIWINRSEALLIIHGINIEENRYVYNLGRAKLSKRGKKFSIEVASEPILTPDDFINEEGHPMVEELHKERRVVYSCGGIVKKKNNDKLYLYVNVGDRTTFEVGFKLEELKAGLF